MCIIFFGNKVRDDYAFVFASNRDEVQTRPTAPLHWWTDPASGAPLHLVGGRDLQALGTWLAVHRSGTLATVTNFRESPENWKPRDEVASRGAVVVEAAQSGRGAPEVVADIASRATQWDGFNLVFRDHLGRLGYATNRWPADDPLAVSDSGVPGLSGAHKMLEDGRRYVLCNANLDTPWPKVERGRSIFHGILDSAKGEPELVASERDVVHDGFVLPEGCLHERLLNELLSDTHTPPDKDLPQNTGVSIKYERMCAPIFVTSRELDYGTTQQSVITITHAGLVQYTERTVLNGTHTTRRIEFLMETSL